MKKTIGLFVNTFYDEYEVSIWEGIKKAINEYGYTLISFVGGSLNNPYFNNKTRNTVYDLACSKNVDGILAISVSIASYIDRDVLQTFFASYSPVPIISIGIPLDNIPHISIDNKSGMDALVTHLVKDHNFRRIAFICGPKKNRDAEVRLYAYKNVLTQFKIPINPQLIVHGSFHVNSGQLAISQLIDERKVAFDAIIGANDYVAINAISELEKRGIRVPADVAVVGFDDVIESQYLEYPLTTVKQPGFKLGYEAAVMMCSLLNKKKIEMDKEIASQLILRNSCGCDNTYKIENIDKYIQSSTNEKINKKQFILAMTDIMKLEFGGSFSPLQLSKLAERLFISLMKELQGKEEGTFFKSLKEIIKDTSRYIPELFSWHTIISFLFIKIAPELSFPDKSDSLLRLFINVSRLIDSITIRNLKYRIVKANEREMHLYSLKKRLHTVLEVYQLKEIMKKEFPLLGIKSCYINVYHKYEQKSSPGAQLLFAYVNERFPDIEPDKQLFDSKLLLPDGIKNNKENKSFIMLSLSYKKELLGFILYELEKPPLGPKSISFTTERSLCEILTIELSNTVKSIMLFNQVAEQVKYIDKKDYESEEKFASNTLPEEKLQEYFQQLLLYMDTEKPFVDLDLTLPYLAEQLNIPRNHLSYVINKYSRVNFYAFVNSYRIKQAKHYLEAAYKEKINILEIAYNSGFKSKSTFYKIFKKHTQLTPTDYRSKYLAGL
ncbi:MAG: substrate-binding domain-containing protein [Spirochaetales bacterium]|nr:substrate-binding domain-containing protein [Spirochaetales bacterium]